VEPEDSGTADGVQRPAADPDQHPAVRLQIHRENRAAQSPETLAVEAAQHTPDVDENIPLRKEAAATPP
jgi:hypothetical protein